jgi:hypothetical protein
MALILMEGFDIEDTEIGLENKNSMSLVDGVIGATTGRGGGGAVRFNNANDYMTKLIGTVDDGRYVRMAWWQEIILGAPLGANSGFLNNTGASISDAHITLYVPDATTVNLINNSTTVASAPFTWSVGEWYHIEIVADLDTTGSCSVYINESLVLSYSGDTLDGSGASNVYGVIEGATNDIRVDDWVIEANDVTPYTAKGFHRIDTLLPNAAGNNSDFTGAYTDVDDPGQGHDGDTTAITSSTLNHISDFNFENLTATDIDTIGGVQYSLFAAKSDAGTREIKPQFTSNVTTVEGATVILSEGYTGAYMLQEDNPDISGAWTETTVNAIIAGVKITL